MKRILHVVTKMDRAGQETFLMNVYRNIDRSEVQFDFLCSDPGKGDYDDEIASMGGMIHILPQNKLKVKYVEYFSMLANIARHLRMMNRTMGYDTIHLHNYHAFSSLIWVTGARMAGFRNIILHCHNTSAPHIYLHKICRPILNLLRFNRFACSSDAARWMYGNREAKIVFNGIEPQKFLYDVSQRMQLRKELGLADSTTAILHIGRFNYQKNHKFLLDVFKEYHDSHPDSRLLLVGKGELEEEIKAQTASSGLTDSVMPLGIRNDIPALLHASDLFLLPSLFEGLSVVLVEAQAEGIPILATSNLSPETIFSVNARQLDLSQEAKEWADAIEPTLSLGRNASAFRNVAEKGFDIKTVAKDLQQFYTRL